MENNVYGNYKTVSMNRDTWVGEVEAYILFLHSTKINLQNCLAKWTCR